MHPSGKFLILVIAFVLLVPVFAFGQMYYLDIPDIQGEVTEPAYRNQICITSFSWKLDRVVAQGGGGAFSSPEEFKFGKSFDRSSPHLFGAVATGEAFDELVFTIVLPGGPGGANKLAVYELTDVIITGYQPGGETESFPIEVFTLEAQRVKISHFRQNPDGSVGQETSFEWNFTTNTGG